MEYKINYKPITIYYDIKNNIVHDMKRRIGENVASSKVLLVSDETVYSLYGEEISDSLKTAFSDVYQLILPSGEEAKSQDSLNRIYNELIKIGATRSDYIAALGGGTIGDVCGYSASTYMRGIHILSIPTTLLSQVDSCIGGKTAINFGNSKNLIGSFYHPTKILIDPCFLDTLPKSEIISGMAEVLKYALICDGPLLETLKKHTLSDLIDEIKLNHVNANADKETQEKFKIANTNNDFLINNIIRRCIRSKVDFVANDPIDTGVRLKLNFGHTIGHAVEALGNFEKYSHGQGVAIGMSMITKISEEKGLTKKGSSETVDELLKRYELPLTSEFTIDQIREKIIYDKKKRGATINYVILDRPGYAYIHQAETDFIG